MNPLTEVEREVLREFLLKNSSLRSAIEKFCNMRRDFLRKECSDYIAQVPADAELAKSYAQKSQVYDQLFTELNHFVQK